MGILWLWQKPSGGDFTISDRDISADQVAVTWGDRPSLEQFSGQLTTIRGLFCRGDS